MSTYQRCPEAVPASASNLMMDHVCFEDLVNAHVTIDWLFAYGQRDEETNELLSDAITHDRSRALGLCRVCTLKERAAGRADAEILIDNDWWEEATPQEREALIDHELYHLKVVSDETGFKLDDLQRPVLKLRKHDYQFGWFKAVAERHGKASTEQRQAKTIMDESGQSFWPEIAAQMHVDQ